LTSLELRLLGSYQVALEGHPVEAFESDKVRLLLAYLAVENDRPVRRGRLVGLFWPEQDEAHARGNLSQALYNLRGVLGQPARTGDLSGSSIPGDSALFLLVTPQMIQLNPLSDTQVDVSQFKALLMACKKHKHHRLESCSECARKLAQAAALYRGDLLAGFALRGCQELEEWLMVQRERLHQKATEMFYHLALYFEGQRDYPQALAHARRLVALEPLDEKAQRMLLRLLALDGQHPAALTSYQAFRQLLTDELGVEPEAETQALNQRLLTETEASQPLMGHLPATLTPLVGRQDELRELTTLVRNPSTRLVTVLGPGGCGKTRLALEVAHSLRYDFPDGVYLVSLSGLASEQSLLPAVAKALGFTFQEELGDVQKQLFDYLREKRMLLLLDSFEEVLAGAGWVSELLSSAPNVQALVTSRARLNTRVEQVFILNGMRFPSSDQDREVLGYSAVQLFVSAAMRVKPDFEAGDPRAIVRVCKAVAGMPLAILLSAGWVGSYPVEEIAAEIGNSLDFLTSEWHGVPERQRSLRATLDYSWRMLSEAEGEAFRKLSVFKGAFSHQVAQQVCEVGPHLLRSLVDKSMLQVDSNGNYRMHDLLHQYAEEKLTEEQSVAGRLRERHAAYYLRQLRDRGSELKSAQQRQTLEELDLMSNDLQAAWQWAARQGKVELLEGAVEGLCLYYDLRCRYQEGKTACRLALECLERATHTGIERLSLRGWLLTWQADFCYQLGEVELGKQMREAGWEVLRQAERAGQDVRRIQALILEMRAKSATDLRQQLDGYQKVAERYEELDEPWWRAWALCRAGHYAACLGEHTLALKLHQEAAELSRKVGEPHRLGATLELLAYDYLILGQWEDGSRLMHEAAESFMAAGDLWAKARAKLHLGTMLGWMGRLGEGHQAVGLSLPLLRQAGYRYDIVYGTLVFGTFELMSGGYASAEHTLQAAMEAARRDGFAREQAFCLAMLGVVALSQGGVPCALARVQESISIYRGIQAAGELGMALGVLALVQRKLGREEPARAALQEALLFAIETKSRFTVIVLSAALVVLLLDAGNVKLALQAHSAARQVPMVACARWFEDIAGQELQAKMASLPPEERQAAEQHGSEMDVYDIFSSMLAEMQISPSSDR
jgi:predicted ATPase/DNA-binding SARP family transcriptional activator